MKFDLLYRRPSFVSHAPSSSKEHVSDYKDLRPPSIAGVPSELSLDRILEGCVRPPCTLRDFMNFCLYVEHSAENLQFYLWFRDYSKRFKEAPQFAQDLSPEWTAKDQSSAIRWIRVEVQAAAKQEPIPIWQSPELLKSPKVYGETESVKSSATSIGGADNPFDTPLTPAATENPFDNPPPVPNYLATSPGAGPPPPSREFGHDRQSLGVGSIRTETSTAVSQGTVFSASTVASETFSNAGLSEPFTVQPFREEVDRVIATYLADDAPRELNLPHAEKKALFIALQKTTHPSAFNYAVNVAFDALSNQLHPNFVRWTIRNCNAPRKWFCVYLGSGLILGGIILSLVVTLSHVGREYRALGAILLGIGFLFLQAANRGVCAILYGLHHRLLYPWEIYLQDEDAAHDLAVNPFSSLGGANSTEDLPWLTSYKKRRLIRKIFDRQVWVQEIAVRRIHDQIYLQSALTSFAATSILMIIFLSVPGGNLF